MTCPKCSAQMRRYPFAKGSEDPGWRCLWVCETCGHGEAEPVAPPAPRRGLFDDDDAE